MIEVLKALGVTVVEVAQMATDVCFVEEQNVGLIRAGLSLEAYTEAVDWLVQEAMEHA